MLAGRGPCRQLLWLTPAAVEQLMLHVSAAACGLTASSRPSEPQDAQLQLQRHSSKLTSVISQGPL